MYVNFMYTNECVLMMYYSVTGIVVVGHDGFEQCKIGLLQLEEYARVNIGAYCA